jgi:hypothetical protein
MDSTSFKKVLQLRYIQATRMLYDLGSLGVFISLAIVLFLFFMFFVIRDSKMTLPVFLGLAIALISLHTSRKDSVFLNNHFEKAAMIFRIEYAGLLLPFFLLALVNRNLLLPLYLILLLLFIPYFKINKNQLQGNRIVNLIPSRLFEWKSGLRKTFLVPFVLYLLAYPATIIKFLPMVLLFFCITSIATFYDENEDQGLLERFGKTAGEIFYNKVIIHTKFLILAFAPVLLISSIIHPDIAIYNGLFLINQIVLLIFIITVKYKHYMPMYNPIQNSNFTATFILLSALPGFFFVPLIYALAYHKKAINKINQFL